MLPDNFEQLYTLAEQIEYLQREETHLKKLIKTSNRSLKIITEQLEQLGTSAPAHLHLQKEDLEKNLGEYNDNLFQVRTMLAKKTGQPAPLPPTEQQKDDNKEPPPYPTPQRFYTYRIEVDHETRVTVEVLSPNKTRMHQATGKTQYALFKDKLSPLLLAAGNNTLNSEQVKALGETLFQILFNGGLQADFQRWYNKFVHQMDQRLRVELDIDEQTVPRLAALPWEFMRIPQSAEMGVTWLGTAPQMVLSRRRTLWGIPQPIGLKPGQKLRIGVAIAAPQDLGALTTDRELAAIRAVAKEYSPLIELLPPVEKATPGNIDKLLRHKKPHILHFIGHSRFKPAAGKTIAEIALVDPDMGNALWVEDDFFSNLFSRARPGVVVLQSCEGGTLSGTHPFSGVAAKIVSQNIAVVVAMQYEVSNRIAVQFARDFYSNLADNQPVDIAVQEARLSISFDTQYQNRSFATPVIFMRVDDGQVFSRG